MSQIDSLNRPSIGFCEHAIDPRGCALCLHREIERLKQENRRVEEMYATFFELVRSNLFPDEKEITETMLERAAERLAEERK